MMNRKSLWFGLVLTNTEVEYVERRLEERIQIEFEVGIDRHMLGELTRRRDGSLDQRLGMVDRLGRRDQR